jgi:hypothetical protein
MTSHIDFQPTVNLAEQRRTPRTRPGHWVEQDNARRRSETAGQHAERVANHIDPVTPPVRFQRTRAVVVWILSPIAWLALALLNLFD